MIKLNREQVVALRASLGVVAIIGTRMSFVAQDSALVIMLRGGRQTAAFCSAEAQQGLGPVASLVLVAAGARHAFLKATPSFP